MMKLGLIYKSKIFPLVFFSIGLFPVFGYAQLAIVENQPLSFGTVAYIAGAATSEVDLNPDGSYISSNIAFILNPTSGLYTLTGGTPSAAYTLAIDSTVNLNGTGPKNFVVDNIVVDPSSSTFDVLGEDYIRVGGRLRTNVNSSGYKNETHSNTINITLSY